MCEETPRSFRLWLLQVIGLLGLLALCLWLALRPKDPSFTIIDFSIPSLPNNQTSSNNGSFNYVLEIQNPNKDSVIYYDDIILMFFNGQDQLGTNTISSFKQGKDRTREVSYRVDVESKVWRGLINGLKNATKELKVNLESRIRYRTLGIRSKHHGFHLQGNFPVGSDGKILGKKKKIKLHHTSKKWRLRATGFH